jgi:Mg-chelatase subunit ChlD
MVDVIFNAPQEAFLFVGSILFFCLYMYLASYKKKMLEKYQLEKNLPTGFFSMNWIAFYARAISLSVAWAFLTIACMQPVLRATIEKDQIDPVPYRHAHVDEVVFVVNTSRSMNESLDRVKEIIKTLTRSLGGINLSLIHFSDKASLVVPPTEDYLYFQIILDTLKSEDRPAKFLEMMDFVKGYIVGAPFSKSALIVLFTDTDAVSDLGKRAPLVVESVKKLSRFNTQVDVVQMNAQNESGTQFLQKVASKGQGRLYVEGEIPLLSLVDSLSADMAVDQRPSEKIGSTKLYEEKQAKLPLIASFLCILAALFLPLAKRKKLHAFITLFVVQSGALFCDEEKPVSQTIDQALVFAEASRQDIAEDFLQKLLAQALTVDERVTVLYDLATLHAKQADFERALQVFNQISDRALERTKKVSPILYTSIFYNFGVTLVQYVQAQMASGSSASDLFTYLKQAEDKAVKVKMVLKEALALADVTDLSFSQLTFLYETIVKTKRELDRLDFLQNMQKIGKHELLKMGISELEVFFQELLALKSEKDVPSAYIGAYMANFQMAARFKIRLFVDQVVLLLQAPTTEVSTRMRAHLAHSILSSDANIRQAFKQNDLEHLLQSLFLLINQIEAVRLEGMRDDILGLLMLRKATCERVQRAPEFFFSFWQEALRDQEAFVFAYIALKREHEKGIKKTLLSSLLSRLQEGKDPCQHIEEDILFFKYSQMPFSNLYPMLFQKDANFSYILDKLDITIAYAKQKDESYEKYEQAKSYLQDAEKAEDARFYILKSWYLIEPDMALLYLSYYLREEVRRTIPQKDVSFLRKLLEDFSKENPQFEQIAEHLQEKKEYLTVEDRFDLYLTLFWLTEMLQKENFSIKTIAQRIDAAIIMQQDVTVSFTRAPGQVLWGWYLQKGLVENVLHLISKSEMDNQVATKIAKLLSDAILLLETVPGSATSQNIERLLLEAKKYLEQEEESKAKEAEAPPTKAKELTLELKQQTLTLPPETSVRLLQELERDDRELFVSNKNNG